MAGAELSGGLPPQPHHKGATGLPAGALNNDRDKGVPEKLNSLPTVIGYGKVREKEGVREAGEMESLQ